jgi:glycosyltransferase involved in cell wall biosynthesis
MRVAIVGNYPWDGTRIKGGVQAAFSYLVKGLSQLEDLQVHILTLSKNHQSEQKQVLQNGITLHLLPALPRFEFVRNYRTYQSYMDHVLSQIQPDVVHAQDATEHAYSALKIGYPTIVTVHGIRREDSRHIGSISQRARNQIHSRLIERYCLRNTRHLIAISHYVTDYFTAQLRPDAKVYYVPNAIDESFFELSDTSDGHTLLFAGRVIPRKRVMDLVQAFAGIAGQCPSAQLRIAGECTSVETYVDSIQQFIEKANLQDRVHLLGALPENAILREFAGCDALVLPSIQETAPMVIAQAMAAGKPVVATRVGGVPEMVSDGKTGFLFEVGDVLKLAETLVRLLRDDSIRAEMGQAGKLKAEANYRASIVAQRTYRAYQDVTGRR